MSLNANGAEVDYCKRCGGSGTSDEQYTTEFDSEGMICGECGGTGEASDD